MAKSQTKPSTPRLSEVARHVVIPTGVVSTGWPAVEAKCLDLGVRFRWWQKPIGQIILGKRADGLYASTIGGTGLSIPRQVGKTFLVGMIIFALCLLRPNLTVVWSAHRLRTAEETFKKLTALTRRKRIAPFISKVVLGSGEESIEFNNGSRIMFGARAAGFGRGFDEVDVVVYDEAQILGESALDDMIPATNQCRQPEGALLLFMGTPPKPTDPGEVFTRMRSEALSGEDEDTAWIEFGADPGYEPAALPAPLSEADWKQIAKANPSFPEDTPKASILRMRKKLGSESFLREGMGIWDERQSALAVIPAEIWQGQRSADPPSADQPPSALALDRWHDGATAIAASWRLDEDVQHVEIVAAEMVDDTTTVVEWLVKTAGEKIPVMIVADSPAAALAAELKSRKVDVHLISAPDFARSCEAFRLGAIQGQLWHSEDSGGPIGSAIAGAERLPVGKAGAWVWNRSRPEVNIAPLVAATAARLGAVSIEPKKPSMSFAF